MFSQDLSNGIVNFGFQENYSFFVLKIILISSSNKDLSQSKSYFM